MLSIYLFENLYIYLATQDDSQKMLYLCKEKLGLFPNVKKFKKPRGSSYISNDQSTVAKATTRNKVGTRTHLLNFKSHLSMYNCDIQVHHILIVCMTAKIWLSENP